LELDPQALQSATVSNSGIIVTNGGQVLMRAAAIVDAVSNVANATVTHSGSIDTTGVQGGSVDILADNGRIRVNGSVRANSSNGSAGGDIYIGRDEQTNILAAVGDASGARLESVGGFVETSGAFLKVDGITVKAKDWLLDPNDIIIGTSTTTDGSIEDAQNATGVSHINATELSNALTAGTNVTVKTNNAATGGNGDITVNAAITNTSAGNKLTLKANRNIVLNNSINVSNIELNAQTGHVGGAGGLSASKSIVINSANNGTLTGNIEGSASVKKTGAGRTMLQGNNTFSGGLVISQGSILLGNGGFATQNYNRAAGTGAITLGDVDTGNKNIGLVL
jgi:autotransporter-associated beta strand protein